MGALTILGGHGVLGSRYVAEYYDPAIGNIASVNKRDDYNIYSPDVLYLIHDFKTDTNLPTLMKVLENWRTQTSSGVFNYVSTLQVYGELPSPVKEDAICDPKTHYARTKWCEEQFVIAFCKAYGRDYRILRPAHVLGPKDGRRALCLLVNKLIAGETINIYEGEKTKDYDYGYFYRDHIHIEDTLRAIELVITKGELNTAYNIGTGKGWPYIEILRVAAGDAYDPNKVKFIPRENATFYMDSTKLNNLGFRPQFLGYGLYLAENHDRN